jgi:diacylglycerol kinase (ATP)
MRYAIITNPACGRMNVDEKRSTLARVAEIFDAEIHGLDTETLDDFTQCTRDLVKRCDVLVTAGGDGTFSEVINSVDTTQTLLAYLPLGTGNAMQYALQYKGNLVDIATNIKNGEIHQFDLIKCDEKKLAFMASIGIDGTIVRLRDRYLAQGETGFKTYLKAAFKAYFSEYKRSNATITMDSTTFEVQNLLSMMVVKQPYYGFAMNVVPMARFNDRQLHVSYINSGLFMFFVGIGTAFTIGNRVGEYRTGQRVSVHLEQPVLLQIDGNPAWENDSFTFTVMESGLKLKF